MNHQRQISLCLYFLTEHMPISLASLSSASIVAHDFAWTVDDDGNQERFCVTWLKRLNGEHIPAVSRPEDLPKLAELVQSMGEDRAFYVKEVTQ